MLLQKYCNRIFAVHAAAAAAAAAAVANTANQAAVTVAAACGPPTVARSRHSRGQLPPTVYYLFAVCCFRFCKQHSSKRPLAVNH